MLGKLVLVLQNKVAVAVLGAVLIGGGGATVAAAATGHLPSLHSGATAAATAGGDKATSGDDHGHEVALEGTLKAYDSAKGTISVLGGHDTTATVFTVDGSTRVNGEHASALADLANAIGHKVQVQAQKQSDGSLKAGKVTVEGEADQGGQGDEHSAEVHGKIASVGPGSFVVAGDDGKQVTVTVNAQTAFAGAAHALDDLKAGQRVEISGAAQADGTVLASRVSAETVGDSSSGGAQHGAEVKGAVVSLASDSFVVAGGDGKQVTVHVGAQTAFAGGAHSLSDLKAGEQVDVLGTSQSDGSVAAVAVRVG